MTQTFPSLQALAEIQINRLLVVVAAVVGTGSQRVHRQS